MRIGIDARTHTCKSVCTISNTLTLNTVTNFYLLIILSDFDECQDVSEKCVPLSHCVNTVGSFKCVCNDGFEGNGHTCRGM